MVLQCLVNSDSYETHISVLEKYWSSLVPESASVDYLRSEFKNIRERFDLAYNPVFRVHSVNPFTVLQSNK
jgi:hypothetical protein